jgi:hypothetical protein
MKLLALISYLSELQVFCGEGRGGGPVVFDPGQRVSKTTCKQTYINYFFAEELPVTAFFRR